MMKSKTFPTIMRFTSTLSLSMLGALLLAACSRMDIERIKKSWWKYVSGYHIGDVLHFDDNNLKDDTIYRDDKPIVIITDCGTELFRNSATLEIKSITTGESGNYHDKGLR